MHYKKLKELCIFLYQKNRRIDKDKVVIGIVF